MRSLLVVLVAVLALLSSACGTCKLEREAVIQIEKNHEHIFTRYVGYVARDPALTQEAKDSEVKLVEKTKGTVERLKKRTEE